MSLARTFTVLKISFLFVMTALNLTASVYYWIYTFMLDAQIELPVMTNKAVFLIATSFIASSSLLFLMVIVFSYKKAKELDKKYYWGITFFAIFSIALVVLANIAFKHHLYN